MRATPAGSRRLASVILLAGALPAAAQNRTVVRVQLSDPIGGPIAGAEIAVLRGLHDVVAHGASDSLGAARFEFDGAKGEYQIRARKLGYGYGERVFSLDRPADTASYHVFMERATPALDSVRVTAQANARTHDFYLDADTIAASTRPLASAWEILTKLRPDMLRGRSGGCGGIQEVWINGERVRDFVIPSTSAATRRNEGVPPGTRYSLRAFAILSEIDPLHISKMIYHDCDDFSVNANHAQNALFITLKQGVEYVPGEGSFVLDAPLPPAPSKQP